MSCPGVSVQSQALALRAAKRSIVLLKNEATNQLPLRAPNHMNHNDGNGSHNIDDHNASDDDNDGEDDGDVQAQERRPVLPLSIAALSGQVICVVGPNANDTSNLLGGYVNRAPVASMPTIVEALKQVRTVGR